MVIEVFSQGNKLVNCYLRKWHFIQSLQIDKFCHFEVYFKDTMLTIPVYKICLKYGDIMYKFQILFVLKIFKYLNAS